MVAKNKPPRSMVFSTASVHALRPQAEAIASSNAEQSKDSLELLSPEASRRTVHELRVHQIELEMQNEELRRVQDELEVSRARYFELYDLAPAGYCTISEAGLILQANLGAASLLGHTRGALVKKPISRFIFKEDQDAYHLLLNQIMASGDTRSLELRLVRHHSVPVWVNLVATALKGADGTQELRIVLSDISSRKQTEAALHKSEAFNLAILDSLSAEIAVLNHDGKIVAINQSWRRFTLENRIELNRPVQPVGVGADYFAACQSSVAENGSVFEDATNALEGIRGVLEGRLPCYSQEYSCHSPEQQRWFNMNVTPFGDGVVISHMNITEQKFTEDALRKQKEFFHMIAENLGDFIAVLDLEGRRIYSSPSFARFIGAGRDLRGSNSFAEIHPDDRECVKKMFNETVQTGCGHQTYYRMLRADGATREMESRGNAIRDSAGQIAQVVFVSRDITDRHRYEEQMRLLAFYDALTELPNRRLLNDRLSQIMAASVRSGCYGALMFLDLDHFKQINDSHGHGVGDLLLIEAADRLKSCVREVDTVARFGGDEFVVIISELAADKSESRSLAENVAEKIRIALSEPYLLRVEHEGATDCFIEHHCAASIGIVLFINHDDRQCDILRWADAAMYKAKEAGRNLIRFYDSAA